MSDDQLGGLKAWWVWILAVTFVVFLFSFQTGYAIVNPKVQGELSLSVAQIATIAAFYTWAFAIFQFFSGAVLDRLGVRLVLPISITLVTLGIFLFANAKSFEMLLLSQVVVAIGSCTGFVGAGYVGGQWFGMAKFSFMFGLVQMIAALTSAFSQNLIGLALDAVTWRKLFNLTAVFGVVLMVLGFMFIRDPKPVVSDHKGSIGEFFASVVKGMVEVLKIGHIWIASLIGALSFGAMLALGVVWMPKILMVHGLSEHTAHLGASMLWLGLAVGSALIPYWSDAIRKRKMPIVISNAIQVAAILALLYIPELSSTVGMALCFIFGFFNAAHMLAFSTSADVVRPFQIGTSAAIVNGIMFIVGGILMSRPGVRIGWGVDAGIEAKSLDLAQYASLPITAAVILAFVISILMRETYPARSEP
ncbi:MAG: MFS transporter [Proteobacteria bacterium]|nr:MFS transporter [Pseudomonadota bacterium]